MAVSPVSRIHSPFVGGSFIAFCCCHFARADGDLCKPSALLAFEASRSKIVSGNVSWHAQIPNEGTLKFVSRLARNGDRIFESLGNADGWVAASGSTRPAVYMRNNEGWWSHFETSMHAHFYESDGPERPHFLDYVKDIRAVGVAPSPRSLNEGVGFNAVWDDPGERVVRWNQTRDGELYTVRAEYDTGSVCEWTINAAKGWNAERISWMRDGETQQTHCDLKQFGEIWFPVRTEFRHNGDLVAVVAVESALLNRDSDEPEFTGHALGMEPGTHITIAGKPAMGMELTVWDGERRAKWLDFANDVNAGRRSWGPSFQRLFATGSTGSPHEGESDRLTARLDTRLASASADLRKHEGAWEVYVREFIARYRLTDDQAQKALEILRQCQQRGRELLASREPQLIPLQSELNAAKDPARRTELEKQIAGLRAPIDAVFEEQLKPRLEKLPTREQHAAAKARGA